MEVSAREGASKLGAVLGGENPRHLDERWTVLDPRERELFHLERYEPIDRPSYAVFDERGAPLGTFALFQPADAGLRSGVRSRVRSRFVMPASPELVWFAARLRDGIDLARGSRKRTTLSRRWERGWG